MAQKWQQVFIKNLITGIFHVFIIFEAGAPRILEQKFVDKLVCLTTDNNYSLFTVIYLFLCKIV